MFSTPGHLWGFQTNQVFLMALKSQPIGVWFTTLSPVTQPLSQGGKGSITLPPQQSAGPHLLPFPTASLAAWEGHFHRLFKSFQIASLMPPSACWITVPPPCFSIKGQTCGLYPSAFRKFSSPFSESSHGLSSWIPAGAFEHGSNLSSLFLLAPKS